MRKKAFRARGAASTTEQRQRVSGEKANKAHDVESSVAARGA